MFADNPDLDAEIRALLAEGRKIDAVKRLREETGIGLAEAKDAVEALERGGPPSAGEPGESSVDAEIVALMEQGRKIDAINAYRGQTGCGLKEAKDAVEALAADHRIVAPSGSGCLGVLLFLAAVALSFKTFLATLIPVASLLST